MNLSYQDYFLINIKRFLLRDKKKSFYTFMRRKIRPKSVLVVEINDFHGETLPSLYKYFADCGYHADFLINKSLGDLRPLDCISPKKPFAAALSISDIKSCLTSDKVKDYEYIFFNSYNFYENGGWRSILNEFPNLKNIGVKIGAYVHRTELFDRSSSSIIRPFVLKNYDNSAIMLNPHYFGKVKIKPKNKVTNFIMVGAIEPERRNCSLLAEAVQNLIKNNITNFKVTIIGRGSLGDLPSSVQKYFDIKGKTNFPTMYDELKKADFFLPLLDPDNFEHERYITTGTSGSFQLIYGFFIPCIIHEKFAGPHGFTEENSSIYSSNQKLYLAMSAAVGMGEQEYLRKQNNIEEYAESLYEISLKNLRSAIDD